MAGAIIGSIIVLAAVLDVAQPVHVIARPCWRCATSPKAPGCSAQKVNLTGARVKLSAGRTGLANPTMKILTGVYELRRRSAGGSEVKNARGSSTGHQRVFQEFNLCQTFGDGELTATRFGQLVSFHRSMRTGADGLWLAPPHRSQALVKNSVSSNR